MRLRGGPLRHRDLRLLVTGSTVSLLGDGIYAVALAVTVLHVSPTAAALAAVSVAGLVPRVAFGLLGGVLADRVSRRAVLLVCDVVRGTVVAAIALLLATGTPPLWALLCLVVPLGAASGVAAPAFGALLPDLVSEDELVAANSVLGSISPLAQMMLGPAIGGALAAYDPGLAMALDAATFAVSAVCVLLLRPAVQHPPDQASRPLPWAHFREGLAYVRATPWLSANLLCGLVITFAVSGAMTLLPLLVTAGYDAPAAQFGYLLAMGGVAATVAAVVVGSRRRPSRPLASSYAWYAVGLAAVAGLGLAPGPLVAAGFVVVLFAGLTAGNILQDSVLGSSVPRELRGRVASLDWVAATAAAPLSVTLAALLTGTVGIRSTYVGAGVLASAASVLGLLLLLRYGRPSEHPLEEPGVGVVEPPEGVVVEGYAVDAAVRGEDPGLRLDLLGSEDPADGRERRVAVEQLHVAGQLLDPIDLAPSLDLDGHGRAGGVAAEDVDRADRRRVLPAHQPPPWAEGLDLVGEQGLQVCLDTVLHQTRVDTQGVARVVQHLLDGDHQPLARLVRHRPGARVLAGPLAQGAGRAHPVQRLVRAVVGVDGDGAVRLHQDQPGRTRQVGGEPADVVDRARRDDQAHGGSP